MEQKLSNLLSVIEESVGGPLFTKQMFGGQCVWIDGQPKTGGVMICGIAKDGRHIFRVDEATKQDIVAAGGKSMMSNPNFPWYVVPKAWEKDRAKLAEMVAKATAYARSPQGAPKKRKTKPTTNSGRSKKKISPSSAKAERQRKEGPARPNAAVTTAYKEDRDFTDSADQSSEVKSERPAKRPKTNDNRPPPAPSTHSMSTRSRR